MSESDKQLLVVYGSVKAAEAALISTSQRLIGAKHSATNARIDALTEQLRLLARDIAKETEL